MILLQAKAGLNPLVVTVRAKGRAKARPAPSKPSIARRSRNAADQESPDDKALLEVPRRLVHRAAAPEDQKGKGLLPRLRDLIQAASCGHLDSKKAKRKFKKNSKDPL